MIKLEALVTRNSRAEFNTRPEMHERAGPYARFRRRSLNIRVEIVPPRSAVSTVARGPRRKSGTTVANPSAAVHSTYGFKRDEGIGQLMTVDDLRSSQCCGVARANRVLWPFTATWPKPETPTDNASQLVYGASY